MDIKELKKRVRLKERISADAVFEGGMLINVETRELYQADVAIWEDTIVKIGDCRAVTGQDTRRIDVSGKYIAPGFINSCANIERSELALPGYGNEVLHQGVTTTVLNTEKLQKVIGKNGTEALLLESQTMPEDYLEFPEDSDSTFPRTKEECLKNLRQGCHVIVSTAVPDWKELLHIIMQYGTESGKMMLAFPDISLKQLTDKEGILSCMNEMIQMGLDPVEIIQMVTVNPARFWQLSDRGSILPGKIADLVVLDQIFPLGISQTYKCGKESRPSEIPRSGLSQIFFPGLSMMEVEENDGYVPPKRVHIYQDQRNLLKQTGAIAFSKGQEVYVLAGRKQDAAVAANRVAKNRGGSCMVCCEKVVAQLVMSVAGGLSECESAISLLQEKESFEKAVYSYFQVSEADIKNEIERRAEEWH